MNKKSYIGILTLICLVATIAPSVTVAASQDGPKYGGTMIFTRISDCSTLNPLLTIDDASFMVGNQIHSSLIWRGLKDGVLTYEPDAAERWEVSADGLTITFWLRDNIYWHDGVQLTADDVKYTFETLYQDASLALPQSGFFDPIDYVEIVDDYTVKMHLEHPSPILMPLGIAFWRDKEIVPKHILEGVDFWDNDYNEAPIGSGPFKFVSWTKGDQIVLEKNENYYMKDADGNQLPYLDKIIFKVSPNSASQIAALETGEGSAMNIVPEPEVKRLQGIDGIYVFPVFNIGLTNYLMMNQGEGENENPILQDKMVRHALLHGMNRQEIIDLALGGFGRVQNSWVSSDLAEFYEPNVPKYDYSPETANQILDDAGYDKGADGFRFTLRIYHTAGDLPRERGSEIIKSQLAEIGVNIDIVTADWPTLKEWITVKYDFDLAWFGHATGPDPDRLFVYYHGSTIAPGNWQGCRYNNPEVDAIWDDSRIETDPPTRAQMFKDIQMIMMEDLPIIPIQERVLFGAARTDFVNMDTLGAYWYCNHMERVWWRGGEDIGPAVSEFAILPGVAFIALVAVGVTWPIIKKKRT